MPGILSAAIFAFIAWWDLPVAAVMLAAALLGLLLPGFAHRRNQDASIARHHAFKSFGEELLDAIQAGIERDRVRRREAKPMAELQKRFDSLTPREREVFTLVVTGRPNKQIAAQAKLSEMTVKVHRSQIMHKMQAKSLVDLVRMADSLGISGRKA